MANARRWLLLAGIACLAADGFAQDKGGPVRSVEITPSGDGYVANVVMQAPVPPKIAWDVLTDFDNMAKWVPNVRESKIVANNGNVSLGATLGDVTLANNTATSAGGAIFAQSLNRRR